MFSSPSILPLMLPATAHLKAYFETWANEPAEKLETLPASGSERRYVRATSASKSALIAYNPNAEENAAFVAYTQHFLNQGLPVPKLYSMPNEANLYLLEDLGDCTLLQQLEQHRQDNQIAASTVAYYKKSLEALARLQINGIEGLPVGDYQQPSHFNRNNMLWDTAYFKYYFLKPKEVPYNEAALERDFNCLIDYLAQVPAQSFMMRDCQARNIMVKDDAVYFIDYQGGKYGPLQYDVASLLYQAKADLPQALRQELLEHYLQALTNLKKIDQRAFKATFYGFVLLRSLQVLGAYGYKGLFQGKTHFIESIPYALKNIQWLLEQQLVPVELPHLQQVLRALIAQHHSTHVLKNTGDAERLMVTVQSFSYRRGIPVDNSGNGGGFVFDCRFIHNPGRYQPYKKLTGRDASVQQFLEEKSNIGEFIDHVKAVVQPAVENYLERQFSHLSINFGCTGGQHRSVYSADAIAAFLEDNYNVEVVLHHREQELKGWKN
jgi:aminoglycoside/choline kinase family phosphotransferase